MRKILGNIGIIFGISLMYLGVLVYVTNTSDNMANKDYTHISTVEARLDFYEDAQSTHEYGKNTNSSNDEIEIYRGNSAFWSSKNAPVKDLYSEITVVNRADGMPKVKEIAEFTEVITTYSH